MLHAATIRGQQRQHALRPLLVIPCGVEQRTHRRQRGIDRPVTTVDRNRVAIEHGSAVTPGRARRLLLRPVARHGDAGRAKTRPRTIVIPVGLRLLSVILLHADGGFRVVVTFPMVGDDHAQRAYHDDHDQRAQRAHRFGHRTRFGTRRHHRSPQPPASADQAPTGKRLPIPI